MQSIKPFYNRLSEKEPKQDSKQIAGKNQHKSKDSKALKKIPEEEPSPSDSKLQKEVSKETRGSSREHLKISKENNIKDKKELTDSSDPEIFDNASKPVRVTCIPSQYIETRPNEF